MAIDRTVFNAWIDDDGSNETGTVATKAAIAAAILDPVDAEFALVPGALTLQAYSSTGAQNDVSLSAAYTYLRCTNATALTISGFSVSGGAPAEGAIVIIDNLGSSTVKVTTQDTGSTAAYRIIAASTSGQILGINGRMQLIYDATSSRWRVSTLDPGRPITPTFSAGDYTASTGSWTVDSADVISLTYQQRGCMVRVAFNIESTDVSATPTSLRRVIPGGFTASVQADNPAQGVNAGTAVTAALVRVSSTTMFFFRDAAGTAWSTTAGDDTAVRGSVEIEVV